MARREDNDFFDDLRERGEKKARRKVKSKLKKLHFVTKVLVAVCLVIGIAAGAVFCTVMSKNDRFVLKGDTVLSLDAGESFTYTEQGVEAVCFGLDASNKLTVTCSEGITRDSAGNYIIPGEEGIYYITYTVDALKFNGKLFGTQIKRIRTFTVNAAEEDGRNG